MSMKLLEESFFGRAWRVSAGHLKSFWKTQTEESAVLRFLFRARDGR